MLKNIIFDFNGTLIDDGYLCFEIEHYIFKSLGANISLTFEEYKNLFVHPVSDYYKRLGLEDNNGIYHKINEEFFSEYEKRQRDEAYLFPGAIETLKKLKEKGYNLYILSATEINLLKKQLDFLGILPYFDELIASSKKDAKGKGEYGKEFAVRHNLNCKNALMIGDTLHDYDVSKVLGVNVLLFDQGHNSKKVLEETGAKVVSSYDQILNYILNFNN